MILEAVVTNPNYLNATHCTLKMTIAFNSSMPPHRSVLYVLMVFQSNRCVSSLMRSDSDRDLIVIC